MNVASVLAWTLAGFLLGSIPFSVLIGRIARVDIRSVGDHNPGATNVLRATGSTPLFVLSFLLDYFKGVLTVGIAFWFAGIRGWGIIPVGLAPLLGHSYSPFLRFKGGKAVATTFGIWTGLTLGAGPLVLGLILPVLYLAVTNSGWATTLTLLSFGGFIVPYYHAPLSWVWLGNLLLIVVRHWTDLKTLPGLRPELLQRVHRWLS